ncbi:MAG: dethiobiotin synthase [Sporichthyaceae bacterium]
MSVLIISGTGTGVGKTVVTAAIAALAADRGAAVAVVKLAQTGLASGEPGDLEDIRRLSGVSDLHEFARFADPLAPAAAARVAGMPEADLDAAVTEIEALAATRRLVLVEGAGGLLVRFDAEGTTIADVARRLSAPVLVVSAPGLGTLNHTALTCEALAHRGVQLAGVVIGSWPSDPDLATRANIADLESIAARPLAGVVPAGAGAAERASFLTLARAGLSPALGGAFDAAQFGLRHRP